MEPIVRFQHDDHRWYVKLRWGRCMASSYWWLCGVCKAVHRHQKYSCIIAFFLRDIWTSDKTHIASAGHRGLKWDLHLPFLQALRTETFIQTRDIIKASFLFSRLMVVWAFYLFGRFLFSTSCNIWFILWDVSILVQMKQFDKSKLSQILCRVRWWHINPCSVLK